MNFVAILILRIAQYSQRIPKKALLIIENIDELACENKISIQIGTELKTSPFKGFSMYNRAVKRAFLSLFRFRI